MCFHFFVLIQGWILDNLVSNFILSFAYAFIVLIVVSYLFEGTLGVGGGFALAAKLANPEANVIILYGDGSLGYSLMEFDTFVRHKVPVTAIIGNDACWTQIAREQVPVLGSDVACKLDYTSYEKAVIALGANGYSVDGTTSESDLIKTIEEAINKTKGENGRPSLVNCLLGKSTFREGSVSV